MLYADHNAARPPHPSALAAYQDAIKTLWGNPSSPHQIGRAARRAIEQARAVVAASIAAKPSELLFTSGATEANFWALLGAKPSRPSLLLSRIEHPSVLSAAEQFQQRGGSLHWAQTPSELIKKIRELRPGLVSVMMAQNETGEVFPVAEIVSAAKGIGALVHCDATQALGRLRVSVEALGVDLLSISGRKLCGLGSSGALYLRRGVSLAPMMPGSSEGGRRAGTISAPDLVAFGDAAGLIEASSLPAMARLASYKERLVSHLLRQVPGAIETTAGRPALANTAHLLLPGCDGEDLLTRLDAAGVCVSTGAACTSGTKQPSHVLLAMGHPPEAARTSLRVSLGPENTQEEIELLCQLIPRLHQESCEALR